MSSANNVVRATLPFEFNHLRAGEVMWAALAKAKEAGATEARVVCLSSEVSEATRKRATLFTPGWRVDVEALWPT